MNERIEVRKGIGEKRVSPIEKLPTDLHRCSIFNYIPNEVLYSLSQTSQAMYSQCEGPLAGKKLLSHIVRAEEELALKMISANLKLLLQTSDATDYSNRTYRGYTPFQAALLCHDVTLWKKMEPYFDGLPDGQTEKAKQFNALFPEGMPLQRPYDFSSLAQTITDSSPADISAALQKTQNDTPICHALNHFRSDFKALAMQETFFNPSHLIRAFEVYTEQFNNWLFWDQKDLFLLQVVGYTQRFIPACLAQAFAQDLYCIVAEHKPLVRSLKFKYCSGVYYPLPDSSGLGSSLCAGVRGSVSSVAKGMSLYWEPHRILRSYAKRIQQNYVDLSAECRVPSAECNVPESPWSSGTIS